MLGKVCGCMLRGGMMRMGDKVPINLGSSFRSKREDETPEALCELSTSWNGNTTKTYLYGVGTQWYFILSQLPTIAHFSNCSL